MNGIAGFVARMTAIHLRRGVIPALLALACLGPLAALAFEPQRGTAAVYDAARFAGRPMANGVRFDPAANHAAHRHLPFGTVARVTNLRTGASTIVVISDRGPFTPGRIIDLSPRSAREIGMGIGLAPVEIRPLEEVAEAP
jgi:rare lipoprotein A